MKINTICAVAWGMLEVPEPSAAAWQERQAIIATLGGELRGIGLVLRSIGFQRFAIVENGEPFVFVNGGTLPACCSAALGWLTDQGKLVA